MKTPFHRNKQTVTILKKNKKLLKIIKNNIKLQKVNTAPKIICCTRHICRVHHITAPLTQPIKDRIVSGPKEKILHMTKMVTDHPNDDG